MTIDKYILRQFVPVFFIAISMFVMLFILIDLFLNLVHYLTYEALFSDIIYASLLHIPKSLSYSIPISLIFAIAYTLGDLYARNELTSVISSGVPFWRIGAPFIIMGAIASVFSFFFEDRIVIPTAAEKNELTRKLRHISSDSEKNSNIVIKTNKGRRVYAIDYFDEKNTMLNGVIIVERNENGTVDSIIRAISARWDGEQWLFNNALVWETRDKSFPVRAFSPQEPYTEEPGVFLRKAVKPEDLSARDLGLLVQDLKAAGLPYVEALANYYHRYSFSSVSFIVVILSISMGGRFRKNIMLMSLLSSISIAVVYYVMEMICMLLASSGYIPPIVGAWFPVVFFVMVGVFLVRYSKT